MMPRPAAMTRPITTQTGETFRSTPPYQSAARAPNNRMKYPTRYMLMKRMGTLVGCRIPDLGRMPGRMAEPISAIRPQSSEPLPRQTNDKCGATVESPGFLARVVVLRPLFAVAHRAEAIRADAAADEVVAHRSGTTLAERQVVLGRADVAGVAFDLHPDVRVLLQHCHRLIERAYRFGPQAIAVEVEVHVLEDDWRRDHRPHDLYVHRIACGLAIGRAGHR